MYSAPRAWADGQHVAYNEFTAHAELAAHEEVSWADPGVALPADRYWPLAEVAPTPGAEMLVSYYTSTRQASVGDEVWLLFQPPMAAINGWDEYPDAIADSAFVRCRVRARETGGSSRVHCLRVEIVEVLPLGELEKRFPARPLPHLETWQLSTGALTRCRDWELWFAPHDDAGYWLLARVAQDEAHVVAAGEWCVNPDYADAWAGHVVLPLSAWRQICQRI